MPVKRIRGTVRTFIPHNLRKMPTANKLKKVIKGLHSKGKPFAINVDSSESNLIYQINISLPLAQHLASQLHEIKTNLKIGTNVVLMAESIGFGQMDAKRIIQVDNKKLARSKIVKDAKLHSHSVPKNSESSSTVKSHVHRSKSDVSKSSAAKSNNKNPVDNKLKNKKTFESSTKNRAYYQSTQAGKLTQKLDILTSSNSNGSDRHIVAMYRRLESQPTNVDDIPKQLKPIFEQENWSGFIKNINKHAGNDFTRVLKNSSVNNWMNYALRSNHIPNNLDKTIKPKTKKKNTINHKDVF